MVAAPTNTATQTPVATVHEEQTQTPVATVHEEEWFHSDTTIWLKEVPFRQWKVKDMFGEDIYPGSSSSQSMSRLDFFLLMFPDNQLSAMITLTNAKLGAKGEQDLTRGELFKFFGILILATRFEFGRRELWSTIPLTRYQPACAFGNTGMSRNRFDVLFTTVVWSNQPEERPGCMTSEYYRWKLVSDFVDCFNYHRKSQYVPLDHICVDESISCWYGLGGHWINIGLPQYVAIDRKPENGCKIQNCGDGRSGVMMRLKIVETAESESLHCYAFDGEEGLLHGTIVLKYLIDPWAHSGDCLVCADSYFASVLAVEELEKMGLVSLEW